jgi:hypothetical protein
MSVEDILSEIPTEDLRNVGVVKGLLILSGHSAVPGCSRSVMSKNVIFPPEGEGYFS